MHKPAIVCSVLQQLFWMTDDRKLVRQVDANQFITLSQSKCAHTLLNTQMSAQCDAVDVPVSHHNLSINYYISIVGRDMPT